MSLKSIGTLLTGFNEIAETGRTTREALDSLKAVTESLSGAQVAAALSASKLSAEQKIDIITSIGLDKAQEQATLSALGLATAEGTATVATGGLTTALNGLGTVIKAHPILAALSVVAALLPLIVKGVDALILTAEEATEKMEESASAFEEATSQLENLNKELETTQDRINELEAKDTLTFVEESELKKLRESVELLRIEADLAEKEQARKAKEAADDTITAYKKNFNHEITSDAVQSYVDFAQTSGSTGLFSDESNIPAMLAGIEQMRRLRDDLDKSSDYYAEDYQHFQGIIDDATNSLWDQVTALKTYKSNLEAIPYSKLSDEQKQALNEINDAIKLVYTSLDPAKWNQIQWDSIVDGGKFDKDIQKLNELASQGEVTAETFKNQFPKLATACKNAGIEVEDVVDNLNASFEKADESGVSTYTAQLSSLSDVISGLKSSYDALADAQSDMNAGGGLSTETIEKLAKENENYLNYLYEENGVIKLNTEAWKENANAKMQSEMAEIQKEIDSLNERNKVLLESIAYFEQMKDTDSNIGMWDQEIAKVRAEIEKNTDAVKENQDLMSLYTAIFGQMRADSDEAFSSLTDHLTFITGQYDIFTKAQEEFAESGILSASTLSSIADKFPEMEDSVSLYIAGLKTSQELLEELSVTYGVDYANYESAVKAKLRTSETFYNSLTDDQKQLISELSKSYGIDLENFQTIEQKKLAFQAEIIKQLAANYSKYAGASLEELQDQYENAIWSGGVDRAEAQALRKTIEAIEKYNRTLNSIVSGVGLTSVYNPKNIKSSSGSSSSSKEAKEVEKYTAAINEYREAEERLRQVQEDRSGIERQIDNSEDLKEQIALRKQLIDVYQQEQDALHNLNNQRDATITAGVQSLRSLGFEVQYNAGTNYLWISNMERLNELVADSKGEYDTLQEATNALRKETEDLIGTLEDLNEENRDGSESWWDLKDSIRDAKVAIINDLKDIVNQASDAVDEIQSVADTLYDAADEFAANDGFITIDTWQKIKDLDDKYLQLLKDENNQWLINEERVNAVIAARTRQLAVENAMSYVERIKLATQEGAVENLNDLIFVTTDATNSTWGLVYAELELMHTMGDLSDSQYQAALHNIRAMQDLAENAVQNIGKATDAVARNLEETRKQATKKGLQDNRNWHKGGRGQLLPLARHKRTLEYSFF